MPYRRLFPLLLVALTAVPAVPPARAALDDEPDAAAQAWHYGSGPAGINLGAVAERSRGAGVVVAVIDSGVVTHPDLAGRVLPGADLISDPMVAGDGTARDLTPIDQGTACTAPVAPSTWQGLHLAGLVAADDANGIGGSGVAPEAWILPVRVSGRCGTTARGDLVDGLRWAAGLPVRDLAANAHPADILLVGPALSGGCDASLRATIEELTGAGALVIAGAGATGGEARELLPVGCAGVLTVGAIDGSADLAAASAGGGLVDLVAPGGGTSGSDSGISSSSNAGTKAATTPTSGVRRGSAQAAAHVAGVAALLLARAPSLSPRAIESLLVRSARPLEGARCALRGCGAGLLDAGAALDALDEEGPGVEDAILSSLPAEGVVDERLALPEASSAGVVLRAVSATPTTCATEADGLHLLGRGECLVLLLSAGAPGIAAASLSVAIAVRGLPTTISLGELGAKSVATGRWPLELSVSDNQSYNLTASGPCAVAGGYLLFRSTGTCRYTVAVPGDPRHAPASATGSLLLTSGPAESPPARLPTIAPPTIVAVIGTTTPSGLIEVRFTAPTGNAAASHVVSCESEEGSSARLTVPGTTTIARVAAGRGRSYRCTVTASRGGSLPGISDRSAPVLLPGTPATPVLLGTTVDEQGVMLRLLDPATSDAGPANTMLVEGLATPISAPIDPGTRTATVVIDGYVGAPRLSVTALGAAPAGIGRSRPLSVAAPRLGPPPVSSFTVAPDPVAPTLTAIATIALPSIVEGDRLRLSIDGALVPFVLTTPAGVRRPEGDGAVTLVPRPTATILRASIPLNHPGATAIDLSITEARGAIGTASVVLDAPERMPSARAVSGSVASVTAVRLTYGAVAADLPYLRGYRVEIDTPSGTTLVRVFGPLLRALTIAIPAPYGDYTLRLIATGVLPDAAPVTFLVRRETSGLSISSVP